MNAFLAGGGAYFLTLIFGVCVGISVAYADRWLQTLANVGVTLVFVAVALSVSNRWPWMGPVFVLSAILTSVVVAAVRLREHPMLEGVGFLRRAAMWILHPRRLVQTSRANR